jgi:hypothetical protein
MATESKMLMTNDNVKTSMKWIKIQIFRAIRMVQKCSTVLMVAEGMHSANLSTIGNQREGHQSSPKNRD